MAVKDEVFWYTQQPSQGNKLAQDRSCDVVIVGGGAMGLIAAEKLAKAGKQVIVVEASFVGGGASGKSSGFITPDSELELATLIKNHGQEEARRLWEFVADGVEIIRRHIRNYHISCDYQEQDCLIVANSKSKFSAPKEEYEARQELNYPSQLIDETSIQNHIGSNKYYGAIRYPGTFGINAFQFCQGMKQALSQLGVTVYEYSPVTAVSLHGVAAGGHTITAEQILLCTDRLLPELGLEPKNVYHVQTFLGITEPLTEEQAKRLFPKGPAMVWDTDLIYQYFRLSGDRRLMIGAASLLYSYVPFEIHNSQLTAHKLERYLATKFPWLKPKLSYLWPGLIGTSKDFVPIAARHATQQNLYYGTAATGVPWAACIGNYLAEKILDGRDDFDQTFNPHRSYPFVSHLQAILRKPLTFAASHGLVKYFR